MNTTIKSLTVGVVFLAAVSFVNAATVFIEHSGATDPTTEGWSASGTSSLGSATTGAWSVDDDSTTAALLYIESLASADEVEANSTGWELSVTLQVTDTNNSADLTRYVDYVDSINDARWGMDFGSTAEGYLTVSLRSSALSYTFNDGDYHSFSLVYDSVSGTASLFADGGSSAILSGYEGMDAGSISTGLIRWGSSSSGATGSADYSAVAFSTIPEASSSALMAMLIAFGFCLIKRRYARQ
ncbi:MAG: hypothetical protein ACQKBT_00310 [Puniceicoccales bacterium]